MSRRRRDKDDPLLKAWVDEVRRLMNVQELTQAALAKRMGVRRQVVNQFYQHESPFRIDCVPQLFNALKPEGVDREKLLKVIVQFYFGEWGAQELLPSARPPAYPHTDWLWELLFPAIWPPILDLTYYPRRVTGILGRLIGATISLVNSAEVIAQNGGFEPGGWNIEKLHNNLETIRSTRNTFDWTYDRDIMIWSIGYFLNVVQHGVSLALDYCIRVWLEAKSRDATGNLEDRLVRLKECDSISTEVREWIEWLIEDFGNCKTPPEAVSAIQGTSGQYAHRPGLDMTLEELEEIFNELFQDKRAQARCVCWIIVRTRVIEHDENRTIRHHFMFPIEWVVTVKAVLWTATFWQAMFADLPETRRRQHLTT